MTSGCERFEREVWNVCTAISCTLKDSWLRHWATSRKVAGSKSDDVIGISHLYNPSGRTMFKVYTQRLSEVYTKNFSCGGKSGRCVGWQSFHFHVPIFLVYGSLNLFKHWGVVRSCTGIALPLYTVTKGKGYPMGFYEVTGRGKRNIFLPLLLLLLVFSPWAGLGRDQSSVRRLVWLWYAASWASSRG